MKILIADDELRIREVVKEYCKLYGYECEEAINGLEVLNKLQKQDYDCVILDIMMPEMDGFSALKEIRKAKDLPIIMLSARQEEDDKLYSFEMGVDDYVTKPFSPKELMARIKAVCERHRRGENQCFSFDDFILDVSGRSLRIADEEVLLTPKEMDLLIYLMKNQGVALSRDKLLEAIWGNDYYGDERTVDTHIKMLRHNLGKYRDCVVTIRGMGYKFENKA